MKLLIAYDSSRCSDEVLEDLGRAGLPSDVEALVISIADVLLPPSEGEVDPNLPKRVSSMIQKSRLEAEHAVEEARALAVRTCQHLQTNFPEWEISAEAYGDSPAWGVVKRADSWRPDLIAVGSHGYSLLKGFLIGSVSQKVLKEAQCSVRIGRVNKERRVSPVCFIIYCDGSPDSERAVQIVLERKWPNEVAVHLTAVFESRPSMTNNLSGSASKAPWVRKRNNDPKVFVPQFIEAAEEKFRRRELVVSSYVKDGDPVSVLIREAARLKADCIFLGARGAGEARRKLSHAASAIARSARCSVEIVRSVSGL